MHFMVWPAGVSKSWLQQDNNGLDVTGFVDKTFNKSHWNESFVKERSQNGREMVGVATVSLTLKATTWLRDVANQQPNCVSRQPAAEKNKSQQKFVVSGSTDGKSVDFLLLLVLLPPCFPLHE